MKNTWLIIGLLVVVALVLGYLGRHRIEAMLGISSVLPSNNSVMTAPVAPSSSPEAMTASPSTSASGAAATANAVFQVGTSTTKGNFATDPQGMTLYVFDKDTPGVSNCSGACAATWPAYAASTATTVTLPAHITVIQRADGTSQFAWDGRPLYHYANDKAVGDTNGDGIGGIWHIVKITQ
jgi:predicted lipoprotein with Yx(FWY)xxD motif